MLLIKHWLISLRFKSFGFPLSMAKRIIPKLVLMGVNANMLFNKAAVNRLEREIEEQEQISIELQAKIDGTKVAIDSLEKIIKLQTKYDD